MRFGWNEQSREHEQSHEFGWTRLIWIDIHAVITRSMHVL